MLPTVLFSARIILKSGFVYGIRSHSTRLKGVGGLWVGVHKNQSIFVARAPRMPFDRESRHVYGIVSWHITYDGGGRRRRHQRDAGGALQYIFSGLVLGVLDAKRGIGCMKCVRRYVSIMLHITRLADYERRYMCVVSVGVHAMHTTLFRLDLTMIPI